MFFSLLEWCYGFFERTHRDEVVSGDTQHPRDSSGEGNIAYLVKVVFAWSLHGKAPIFPTPLFFRYESLSLAHLQREGA